MVQELHVLRCYCCETFQSHIVKKTNKWECKMCGAKQSIRKVYGRGSGKECRLHTQKLNALKGEKYDIKRFTEEAEEIYEPEPSHDRLLTDQHNSFASAEQLSHTSKWAEFLNENDIGACQKSFGTPEKTNFSNFKLVKNQGHKRKLSESCEITEDQGISTCPDDLDSIDSIYSTFSKTSLRAYVKKNKFNKGYDECKGFRSRDAACINASETQRIKTKQNNTLYLKSNIQKQTDIKNNIKWESHLEEIDGKKINPMPKTANKLEKDTQVSLKWKKYLEEDDVQKENSSMTTCISRKEPENVPQENKGVFRFHGSNGFQSTSSESFTISKTLENCIGFNDANDWTMSNHQQEKNFQSNDDNGYDFKLKNQYRSTTLMADTLKQRDISVKERNKHNEHSESKKLSSLPIFEQNFELSDNDFQLDF